MVPYLTHCDRLAHREAQHVFVRNAGASDTRKVPKPEAVIERRIAHEGEPARASAPQRLESCLDERAADPATLVLRSYGHRTEKEPARRCVADPSGRKRDVADDDAINLCDQRKLESARVPQRFDDEVLGLLTERMVPERREVDLTDGREVVRGLVTNDHGYPSRKAAFNAQAEQPAEPACSSL